MPSQVDTEASLLKPATRTGILAIFMTQGKKEGASSSGVRSLEAPWVSQRLFYLPARVWPLSVLIFNSSYSAGGKVSELFV